MADKKQIVFPFPIKGVNEDFAYDKQPDETTPDALNVRAYDAIGQRQRGGQRNGTSKYIAAAVNGTAAIQCISQLTTAFDPTAVIPNLAIFGPDPFTQADGLLDQAAYFTKLSSAATAWASANALSHQVTPTTPVVSSNKVIRTTVYMAAAFPRAALAPGSSYALEGDVQAAAAGSGGAGGGFSFLFRCPAITANSDLASDTYASAGLTDIRGANLSASCVPYIRFGSNASDYALSGATLNTLGYPTSYFLTPRHLMLTVSGNTARLYLEGALLVTLTSARLAANTGVGFAPPYDAAGGVTFDNFTVSTAGIPASSRTTKLLVVSGGSLYTGSKTAGLVQAISGASAQIGSGRTSIQQAYGRAYLCDGFFTDYKVYDPVTNQVTGWTARAGSLPGGGVTATLTGANVANSTFTVASATGLAVGQMVVVQSSTTNSGSYRITTIAGTTITVTPAPVNASETGTMLASGACTIIALYRGRVVLSGLPSDPQNWFMSKVGDPLDWNYTPTTITQTMAVAGNNSTAGLLGDVITCLAPFNDDLMFMGGDHTLWVMRGDPAAGGMIDNISYQTGIVGPDAWTRSPDGDFYFFGAGSLWTVPAGSTVPQPLSRGVLDRTLGAIDYSILQVRLFWDDIAKGVHLYFTPASQPLSAPRHYFWDKRAGGFWPDEYPIVQGPTAVWLYDADLPTDRAFLLGGFDSYIRQLPTVVQEDDDGTVIHSRVRYAPQIMGGSLQNTKLSELMAIMSDNSDPVALRVFSADSAEDAATTSTPQVSKMLSWGRNSTMRQRVTGNSTLIELESVANAWAAATYYAAGVQVMQGGVLYTCLLPHTSGVFATNLAAADWEVGTTRSWAAEAITGVIEVSGKVRHRRL